MYNVSSEFLKDIYKSSRTVKSKVLIAETEITDNQIINFEIESLFSNEELPGIGGVVSSRLKLNLIRDNVTPTYYTNQNIRPYVAIKLSNNNVFEYIPLGVFKPNIESIEKTDYSIQIECEDILT